MASDDDRRLLAKIATDGPAKKKKRWEGITDDVKSNAVKALNVALRMALEKGDQRGVNGCVKTLVAIEGQNQADEHLDRKEARTDEGKVNERVEVVFRNQIAGNDHGAG